MAVNSNRWIIVELSQPKLSRVELSRVESMCFHRGTTSTFGALVLLLFAAKISSFFARSLTRFARGGKSIATK